MRRKQNPGWLHVWLWVALSAWLVGAPAHAQRGTGSAAISIRPDGACVVRSESTMPRAMIEAQIRMMDRYKELDGEDDDDDFSQPPSPPAAEPDAKLTDEQLKARVRQMYSERVGWGRRFGETEVESVEIEAETVRIVTTTSFGSLEDFVAASPLMLSSFGFGGLKADTDETGRLRLTLSSEADDSSRKQMAQRLRLMGLKAELRFELPGEVISSPFPGRDGSATWINVDGSEAETVNALVRLWEAPAVIVAEPGGLTLAEPLDSKTLIRTHWQQERGAPELPVQQARPGYTAEVTQVVTTTVYEFRPRDKQAGEDEGMDGETDGVQLHVKLFAPKGRVVRTVSNARVVRARDDQGRAIAIAEAGGQEKMRFHARTSRSGQQSGESAEVTVTLPLPAADAVALEEVEIEAVMLTAGGFKEKLVQELTPAPKEIDLADLLAGATLTITKVGETHGMDHVQLTVTGPAEVRQLEFALRAGGDRHSSGFVADDRATRKQERVERRVTLYHHGSGRHGGRAAPLTLEVRLPTDLANEKVRLTLREVDLF
jgi:hypothetical protein